MVENVGVAVGIASPVLSIQMLFQLPVSWPTFWVPDMRRCRALSAVPYLSRVRVTSELTRHTAYSSGSFNVHEMIAAIESWRRPLQSMSDSKLNSWTARRSYVLGGCRIPLGVTTIVNK